MSSLAAKLWQHLSNRQMQRLLALATLVLLGLVLVWLDTRVVRQPYTELPQEHGEPDYYVEQALLTRYGPDGRLLQTVTSPQVTHYPDSDLVLFNEPVVHHHTEQGLVWRLTARYAEYDANRELYLENQVQIKPLNPDSAYLPEFMTERLWLDTLNHTGQTSDPVSFSSPGGQTRGEGLEIDLNSGLATLLRQVRAEYLPGAPLQELQP